MKNLKTKIGMFVSGLVALTSAAGLVIVMLCTGCEKERVLPKEKVVPMMLQSAPAKAGVNPLHKN